MNKIKYYFGKKVKKYRLLKNISQEEFAEKIDIAVNNFGKIERGQNFVTAETLEKIVKVLDIDVKDLFDFEFQKSTDEMKKELIKAFDNTQMLELMYRFFKVLN